MKILPLPSAEENTSGVLALLELALDASEEDGLPLISGSKLNGSIAHFLTATFRTSPLYNRALLSLLFFRGLKDAFNHLYCLEDPLPLWSGQC